MIRYELFQDASGNWRSKNHNDYKLNEVIVDIISDEPGIREYVTCGHKETARLAIDAFVNDVCDSVNHNNHVESDLLSKALNVMSLPWYKKILGIAPEYAELKDALAAYYSPRK
jgi:hypothetical protein